ncbi:hypothetical protein GEMRC1_000747 [Eukaryota sp. GEM-RC1]
MAAVGIAPNLVDNPSARTPVTLRDCVEEHLLETAVLLVPRTSRSDADLRRYLEDLAGFPFIENRYSALSKIKIDSSIKEARSRFFDYTGRFLAVRKRAAEYYIPEESLLRRFTSGVIPSGLAESLKLCVSDKIITVLPEAMEIVLDELIHLERSDSWKSRSRLSSSIEPVSTRQQMLTSI